VGHTDCWSHTGPPTHRKMSGADPDPVPLKHGFSFADTFKSRVLEAKMLRRHRFLRTLSWAGDVKGFVQERRHPQRDQDRGTRSGLSPERICGNIWTEAGA